MAIQRVAVIFDDRARPETTGVYCRRALERLVEVAHFRPDELDQVPREGFDVDVNIDDGFDYRLPPELDPSVFRAIDTHVNFDSCLRRARGFDLVFAAQRDGADRLRRAGIASAAWLPLACDPEIHRRHEIAKQNDVAFVGNVFPGPREELLDLIRRKYRNAFIGQCYFDEMARTYSAARVVFNRSVTNDVNMRVFEALACGSLLLTSDLSDNGQAELFRDGVHLATYREPDDLLDKLAFYLQRDATRERIAADGCAEVLSRHTYLHRMERLLREAETGMARKAVPVGWVKPTDPNANIGGFHPPYSSSQAPAGTDARPTGNQPGAISGAGVPARVACAPAGTPAPLGRGTRTQSTSATRGPRSWPLFPIRPAGFWTSAVAQGGSATHSKRGSRLRSGASSAAIKPLNSRDKNWTRLSSAMSKHWTSISSPPRSTRSSAATFSSICASPSGCCAVPGIGWHPRAASSRASPTSGTIA